MSLLNTFVPLPSDDVIAILNADGDQILADGRAMNMSVVEASRKFNHPLETNAVRSDHKIILPVEINMRIIFEADFYEDGYRELKELYLNSDELSVQTRVDTYDSMVIVSMPHEETVELFNAIAIDIKFEETLIGITEIVEGNPEFSTTNRGQVQSQDPSPDQAGGGSVAFDLFFGG